MNASSATRHPKLARLDKTQDVTAVGTNRLQSLSDAILVHILSFLPMKEAVRTSLLSKEWVYLWTLLPNLHFDGYEITGSTHYRDFFFNGEKIVAESLNQSPNPMNQRIIESIERVFVLRDPQYTVKAFTVKDLVIAKGNNNNPFYCSHNNNKASYCSRISACVKVAIKCRMQELSMDLYDCCESSEVPYLIFRCQTLVKLDLTFFWSGTFSIPFPVQLPNLKVLRLDGVRFADNLSAEKLFSCPLLEELYIRIYGWENGTTLRICAPKLRKLTIDEECDVSGNQLSIDATNLEYFEHNYNLKNNFVLNSEKLVKVVITLTPEEDPYDYMSNAEYLFQLLGNVSSTKNMFLATHKAYLDDDNLYKVQHLLPVFHNLIHLELEIDSMSSEAFLTMLRKFPHLQSLKLQLIEGTQLPDDEGEEDELEDAPSCFSTHLKKISFREIIASKEELDIVRILLRNATVLEEMILWCSGYEPPLYMERLKSLPIVSTNCTLSIKLYS